jgi:hypothetical protein
MTAAQLDLLAQLATMTDDQGDHKTPQGLQEALGADEAPQADQEDAVVAWQGFSGDTSDDEARRLFTARYGRPPAKVKRDRGLLLAGPL